MKLSIKTILIMLLSCLLSACASLEPPSAEEIEKADYGIATPQDQLSEEYTYEIEVPSNDTGGDVKITCKGTEKDIEIKFRIDQVDDIIRLTKAKKLLDQGSIDNEIKNKQIQSFIDAMKGAKPKRIVCEANKFKGFGMPTCGADDIEESKALSKCLSH